MAIKISASQKRIHARFYASDSGNEPVKEALLELGRPTKTVVGEDIRFVEMNWRVDRPYVDRLRSGKGRFEETLFQEDFKKDTEVRFGSWLGSNEKMDA